MQNSPSGATLAPSAAHAERLLNAQQVADHLGVSERWVRDHATRRNPRIPAVKLGPLLRFRWEDVQALVARLTTEKSFKRR
jgi:predicted DNA-binding transcriptional regulator AlpA